MSDKTVYEFKVTTIDGAHVPMDHYKDKVLLIVNVASKCGLTPQYEGLEELYEKYHEYGFEVLGFPCNQFAGQEPGTHEEIAEFCTLNYGVKFPMFAKVDVNGKNADPLFKFLRKETKSLLGLDLVKWNFTKFLVDMSGHVVKRFEPMTAPADIAPDVAKLLKEA
ncbi:MAG: glutathione peroxidase [Alphaproteobacteria bacterium]|nr:MAG: glutathione peroxidase [Alphaproteobacteria bacterium]